MIKGLAADIIITIYLLSTLLLRFYAEGGLAEHPFMSLTAGVIFLVFLWALIKAKILVPDYFGLLKKKSK